MQLPENLKIAITEQISKIKMNQLAEASEELSARYRTREVSTFMASEKHRLAYLAARMPATYAALSRVFQEIKLRMPHLDVQSGLDLGAGPGTGMWAASEAFPELKKMALVEQDRELIRLGKALVSGSLPSLDWQEGDVQKRESFPQADLVLMSYAIGELKESFWEELIKKLWTATGKILVFIEPGTPVGFQRIRRIREILIQLGATIAAPCPHQKACPIVGNDWCHFSQRIERASFHRTAKGAELGYEDEKFSYVVASKEKLMPGSPRILRHPQKRPGHVSLVLCTEDGIKERIISKRNKEDYRNARKIEWGETLFSSTS